MRQQATVQRRHLRRFDVRKVRPLLTFFMILVFAVSGIGHALMADHTAPQETPSYELTSSSHVSDGNMCCPEHRGQPHGTSCGIVGPCGMCAPVVGSVRQASFGTEPAVAMAKAIPFGRVTSPHLPPPKAFLNV